LAGIFEGAYGLSALLRLDVAVFPVSDVTVLIICLLFLLLITGVTAGAETAFFSLKAKDVNYLKTRETPAARQAVRLLDQPRQLLATIVVVHGFVDIAIVVTAGILADGLFTHLEMPEKGLTALLLKIVTITLLLVLFGSVLPRVYAAQNPMRMSLVSAPLLSFLNYIFRPIIRLLMSSSAYIGEKLGGRQEAISGVDFEQAIELTVGHTATREEVNIFKGILKFGNITVRQIMRTRLDVSGIPHELTFPEVQRLAIESGYSRMPVYRENLDRIAGMIHTKDFLPHTEDDTFDWHTLIRPAYFVHEGKLIEDLLHEFQQKRIHFAVVVDEFGGTSGIVTLEDIMEEIIGDIRDEFDEEDHNYKKVDDRNFIFEGKMLINDMCRIISIPYSTFDEVKGQSDSVAGLILEIAGKFPSVNERINYRNIDFIILSIDKLRIGKVKVEIE